MGEESKSRKANNYERSKKLMKKNKMMRLASFLLVAVLLTTSIISGTFAKYVTSDETGDQARVAKFGVVVTGSGKLFDKTYFRANVNTPGGDANDTNDTILTVESSNGDNLVAPGTKSWDSGLSIAVTGTPEVDVMVTYDLDAVEDVFLKAATNLPDMTTGNKEDTFDNDEDYYPIKFTVKRITKVPGVVSTTTETIAEGLTLAELKTTFEGLSQRYDANTVLEEVAGTLVITWEWDFDDNGEGTYDKQDTLLGDLASKKLNGFIFTPALPTGFAEGTDYNLDVNVSISATVTQID